MDGRGSEDEREREARGWLDSRVELERLVGLVTGRFDARWEALGGPELVSMRDADLQALYAAHREAEALSGRVRAALLACGLRAEEFPELCGKVDSRGRAMVVLGGVSAATVVRLLVVLVGPGGSGNSAGQGEASGSAA